MKMSVIGEEEGGSSEERIHEVVNEDQSASEREEIEDQEDGDGDRGQDEDDDGAGHLPETQQILERFSISYRSRRQDSQRPSVTLATPSPRSGRGSFSGAGGATGALEDQDELELRTRRLENVLRRMSSSQQTNGSASGGGGGSGGGPIRRGRRRAVTISDHKSCALVQNRLKLGDIM